MRYHPFLIFLAATYLCSVPCIYGAERVSRPNIVVFITDDHSQIDSSAYGSLDVRTPNMQRLADRGMCFSHAFVASPSCAPSRAALLTGLMPARNGAEPNHSAPRRVIKKLPAYLHDLGYQVVAFGKVAHYNQAELFDFDQYAADKWLEEGNIAAAIKYLQEYDGQKPVCIFVGTHEPHVPWPKNSGYSDADLTLPPTHVDTGQTRSFRTQYYTAITDADAKLGTIYDLAYESLGPDTVFIFSSDHGAQWPFGKWNLYDDGIRVPLIVSWPGVVAPGSKTGALVSWVDLLPTLVEIAGGSPPSENAIDGRSFASVLRNERETHRELIFTTHSGDGNFNVYPMRSVRDQRWKYIKNLHPELLYTTHITKARDPDGTGYWNTWVEAAKDDSNAARIVQRYRQRPAEELYDLENDPFEQHNLADDPDQLIRLEKMRQELQAWMQQQGDQQKLYGNPQLLGDLQSSESQLK